MVRKYKQSEMMIQDNEKERKKESTEIDKKKLNQGRKLITVPRS